MRLPLGCVSVRDDGGSFLFDVGERLLSQLVSFGALHCCLFGEGFRRQSSKVAFVVFGNCGPTGIAVRGWHVLLCGANEQRYLARERS